MFMEIIVVGISLASSGEKFISSTVLKAQTSLVDLLSFSKTKNLPASNSEGFVEINAF